MNPQIGLRQTQEPILKNLETARDQRVNRGNASNPPLALDLTLGTSCTGKTVLIVSIKLIKTLVPGAGLEPASPFGQRILSAQRIPFRHPGNFQRVQ